MPLIQVTAPKGLLNKEQQNELMSRLSKAIIKSEGADFEFPAASALVWAQYHEVAEGSYYVAGEPTERAPLAIQMIAPEGAIAGELKEKFIKEIGGIVDDIVGPYDGRLNYWAIFHDIREGSWTAAGQAFPLAGIQEVMGIQTAA